MNLLPNIQTKIQPTNKCNDWFAYFNYGNSEIGVHIWRNLGYLICLRHLIRSRAVTNLIFFFIKEHFYAQHVLIYLIYLQFRYKAGQRVYNGGGRGKAGGSRPGPLLLLEDDGSALPGGNTVLHVSGADSRTRIQLQVGHLVAGLPALRDGRASVAFLRRQDELVFSLQENWTGKLIPIVFCMSEKSCPFLYSNSLYKKWTRL